MSAVVNSIRLSSPTSSVAATVSSSAISVDPLSVVVFSSFAACSVDCPDSRRRSRWRALRRMRGSLLIAAYQSLNS